jgi:tetratricopeptide (TPR) repeat protein
MSMRYRDAPPGRLAAHLIVTLAVLLACLGGLIALGFRRGPGAVASLNDVRALARAGRFDRARALLAPYLRTRPDDPRARLLMAQLAMEPPTPDPDLALENLRAIHSASPKEAAVVKFYEGKAQYQRSRYDLAEDCWREALRLDPVVPEAGWALMDLLDKEGRVEEAHRLGMSLHEVEPDPIDRVKILLEVSRIDIEKVAPGSQVQLFEPLARQHPENLPLARTAGLALIHDSRSDEGIEILHEALRRHPDSREAWDAWLTGLYDASRFDRFAEEFARVPRPMADDPLLAKHEGKIAQNARDWPRAVRAYRRACESEPSDQAMLYRLWFALRQVDDAAEFRRIDRVYQDYREAYRRLRGNVFEGRPAAITPDPGAEDMGKRRGVYYETIAIPSFGVLPDPERYHLLADLRERMGRADEARAWHRLVLRDDPSEAVSLAALERLK